MHFLLHQRYNDFMISGELLYSKILGIIYYQTLLPKMQIYLVLIIKGFWIIVFIFIVISTTFQLICPLAFFRCLLNLGTYMQLRTTSFIESTGVACSDSVNHNRVKLLRVPGLLLTCRQDWSCNLQMIVSWGNQRLYSLRYVSCWWRQ